MEDVIVQIWRKNSEIDLLVDNKQQYLHINNFLSFIVKTLDNS